MFSGIITGKRIGEGVFIEEQPPLKRTRVEEKTDSMDQLPWDLLGRISLLLPTARDLCIFEFVFRQAMFCTDTAWEELSKRECLDFDWSLFSDKEGHQKKAHYLHGKVLSVYISAREKLTSSSDSTWLIPSPEQVKRIFSRFEGIMERYPSTLGAFIWQDLNSLTKIESHSSQLFQKNFAADASLAAGNFLLKGLSCLSSSLSPYSFLLDADVKLHRLACESLNQAILEGASCASYLAIQMAFGKDSGGESPESWCLPLTFLSIDKKRDYRGLEMLLEKKAFLGQKLYQQGISYPPVVAKAALYHRGQEAESLFNRAIEGYQDSPIPAWVWEQAGCVKHALKKFPEVEKCFTAAVAAYGDKVPAATLGNFACLKMRLGKAEEAEKYFTAAVAAYGDAAVAAYGDKVPAATLNNFAWVKKKLGKAEEAEKCYTAAVAAYGDKVPAVTLDNLACVKMKLGKAEEAEKDFTAAVAAYGDKVPAATLNNFACLKMKLGKGEEAEKYFTAAVAAYGDKVPAVTLDDLAWVKTRLGKGEEAEEYYIQAIAAYGSDVPDQVRKDLAAVKQKLNKKV